MNSDKKTISVVLLSAIIFFTAGFYGRLAYYRYYLKDRREPVSNAISVRSQDQKYQYVNPLLGCDVDRRIEFGELTELKKNVTSIIDRYKKTQTIEDSSVYFRNLSDGHWFGVNQDEKFIPASLFKVPVMIAFYKLAEPNPGLLNKKLRLVKTVSIMKQKVKPEKQIELNTWYSIEYLIQAMIRYSDNLALELLLKEMDQAVYKEILSDLGIDFSVSIDPQKPDFLTTKTYALLFRVLRNATYLNRDFSEKALRLLTETTFKDGIIAGIGNSSIPVAHKFGERELNNSQKRKELHDCGIVYFYENPYLLCVMTRGNEASPLPRVIQEISGSVHLFMTRMFAKQKELLQ